MKYDKLLDMPETAQKMYKDFIVYAVLRDKKHLLKSIKNHSLDYSKCGSPIEIIFNVAFDIMNFLGQDDRKLIPQYELVAKGHKYILDFAYIKPDFKLAIECDGHEFHEKTKEQVTYGNERDYLLQMEGFSILHFSGSQINNDPFECATTVHRFIHSKEKGEDHVILRETAQENSPMGVV